MRVSSWHRLFRLFAWFVGAEPSRARRRWTARSAVAVVTAVAVLVLQSVLTVLAPASAASPLNVFVGYMDTHSVASSAKQPKPWPYTDPTGYVGSPCPAYPNSTTCWDAAALRLDNPGSVDVTGIHPVVTIGSSTYNLWGSNLTVKAHGTLVLTETGAQNSTNFDGSDFAPNSYNGGNTASCVNSGAIPDVKITLGGATTSYLDSGPGAQRGWSRQRTLRQWQLRQRPGRRVAPLGPDRDGSSRAPDGAAEPGGRRGRRLGEPGVGRADVGRGVTRHGLHHLPRHERRGRERHADRDERQDDHVRRHGQSQRHEVLLHRCGRERGRHVAAVERGVRDASIHATDGAHGSYRVGGGGG